MRLILLPDFQGAPDRLVINPEHVSAIYKTGGTDGFPEYCSISLLGRKFPVEVRLDFDTCIRKLYNGEPYTGII